MTIKPKGKNFNIARKQQIIYLDNLKLFLILLVVAYHTARAYTGGQWLVQTHAHVQMFFAGCFASLLSFSVSYALRKVPVVKIIVGEA